jgi:hypothetical protein
MNDARGKMLLLVSGILLIIFGGINLIATFLGMAAYTALSVFPVLDVVIALIGGLFGIFVGILGIKNCAVPEKAQQCLMADVILMVYLAIAPIITTIFGVETINNVLALAEAPESMAGTLTVAVIFGLVLGILLSLIIPVLYLAGALLNKKSLAQGRQFPQQGSLGQ